VNAIVTTELPSFDKVSDANGLKLVGGLEVTIRMSVSLAMCAVDFSSTSMSPEDMAIAERIAELKQQLGDDLLILGHHYQRDSIVMHADFLGDSFMLSQKAAESDAKYIVFCGVHFMAESADILTSDEQIVMLPNLRAGCSMADMATLVDVEVAWSEMLASTNLQDPIEKEDPASIAEEGESYLVPVTYMNSSADLKDFVGRHGGIVCTSSNAEGVLQWAFDRAGPNGAVLFFPDQHLGRNTGLRMGITEGQMPTWTPNVGASSDLSNARIILWHGFCSVHKRFKPSQIADFRQRHPEGVVVVHPECPKETVDVADANGSTQYIINYVNNLPQGSTVAIGTEINMVARLADDHPDKHIECLDPEICPCSTMYMIHPAYLMDLLEKLADGQVHNQISVSNEVQEGSLLALERMLSIRV
jgi:quinolinate synthase